MDRPRGHLTGRLRLRLPWRRRIAPDADCLSPDPRICTLTPNGHLELGGGSGSRGSRSSERRSFTADSRKSSVMSLGKSSLERRSLSLVRPHAVHVSTQKSSDNNSDVRREEQTFLIRRESPPLLCGFLSFSKPSQSEEISRGSRIQPSTQPSCSGFMT